MRLRAGVIALPETSLLISKSRVSGISFDEIFETWNQGYADFRMKIPTIENRPVFLDEKCPGLTGRTTLLKIGFSLFANIIFTCKFVHIV